MKSMKEIVMEAVNWTAPEISEQMPYGDMPGDKVCIVDALVKNANTIFPALLQEMSKKLEQAENERIVITICGGSGVGKSGIASLISYYLNQLGIESYTLSGDNYPLRIPMYNDAERLRIYRNAGIQALLKAQEYSKERFEILHQLQIDGKDADRELIQEYPWLAVYMDGGRESLRGYLGTNQELDFAALNDIVRQYKSGAERIWLKRMGREDTELWYDEITFAKSGVLVIEWTHGNSDYYEGVDIPVLLNSTPQETMAYRKARSRDGQTDSPFTTMVLELEQNLLEQQAHKAKIILSKQGELLRFEQYQALMKAAKGENDE